LCDLDSKGEEGSKRACDALETIKSHMQEAVAATGVEAVTKVVSASLVHLLKVLDASLVVMACTSHHGEECDAWGGLIAVWRFADSCLLIPVLLLSNS